MLGGVPYRVLPSVPPVHTRLRCVAWQKTILCIRIILMVQVLSFSWVHPLVQLAVSWLGPRVYRASLENTKLVKGRKGAHRVNQVNTGWSKEHPPKQKVVRHAHPADMVQVRQHPPSILVSFVQRVNIVLRNRPTMLNYAMLVTKVRWVNRCPNATVHARPVPTV